MPRWLGLTSPAMSSTASGTTPFHRDRQIKLLFPDRPLGRHWCFKAISRQAVDAFWRAGLETGGDDEGAPGVRENYHRTYYAAFLSDPDGNRIEAVCHKAVP